MTATENLRLIQEIDANRRFMLLAYASNASLLARADESIRRLFPAASKAAAVPPTPTSGPGAGPAE